MKNLTGYLVAAGGTAAVILYIVAAYGAATVTVALNGDAQPSAFEQPIESVEFGAFEVTRPQAGSATGAWLYRCNSKNSS